MTSLYNRATPSQKRILRAIEGAVKNAHDAHPKWTLDHPLIRRSIAKRAAGILTAQWPEVLTANAIASPSDRGEASRTPFPTHVKPVRIHAKGGRLVSKRSPLRKLWKQLSWRAGEAKRAGQTERAETLIEILRIVAAMQKGS